MADKTGAINHEMQISLASQITGYANSGSIWLGSCVAVNHYKVCLIQQSLW